MLLDKQKLIKQMIVAFNECLVGDAEKNYKAAFEAIDGKIVSFVNDVSAALDKRFQD